MQNRDPYKGFKYNASVLLLSVPSLAHRFEEHLQVVLVNLNDASVE